MAQNDIDYHKVLADMEAKRDAMNVAIEGMRLMLGLASGSGGAALSPITGELLIENGAFFGMSIQDAAEKYLRMTPRVLRATKEIADALEEGGFDTSSKRFFNTVYNSLSRYTAPNGPFVKVNGKWGLLEWYPNYKAKARKAGGVEEEITEEPADENTDEVMAAGLVMESSTSVS